MDGKPLDDFELRIGVGHVFDSIHLEIYNPTYRTYASDIYASYIYASPCILLYICMSCFTHTVDSHIKMNSTKIIRNAQLGRADSPSSGEESTESPCSSTRILHRRGHHDHHS